MENLGFKVGDAVIILGNEPTRAEIIKIDALLYGHAEFKVTMIALRQSFAIEGSAEILKKFLEHDTALTFAAELQRSRDQHFGRLFGKWLKENDVEGQIRRAAKEGYLGITFDLKQGYSDECKKLLTDTRFEPTIKRKFGEEFYIKRNTDPIYFLGTDTVIGRHNKVILRWGK